MDKKKIIIIVISELLFFIIAGIFLFVVKIEETYDFFILIGTSILKLIVYDKNQIINTEKVIIKTDVVNINTNQISNNQNKEEIYQGFYEKMKSKKWEDIFDFLSIIGNNTILLSYFDEIQRAKSTKQFNLNSKNGKFNIKIQKDFLIMDKNTKGRTITIGKDGFDDLLNEFLMDFRKELSHYAVDKEHELNKLEKKIKNKEIRSVYRERESLFRVFPDKLFSGTKVKKIGQKIRVVLRPNCLIGIYSEPTNRTDYRIIVESKSNLKPNTVYFDNSGNCYLDSGGKKEISSKEWDNFTENITSIFTEFKDEILF